MTHVPRFQPSPTASDSSSVGAVDLRIGVTQAPRELAIELSEDADRGDVKAKVEAVKTLNKVEAKKDQEVKTKIEKPKVLSEKAKKPVASPKPLEKPMLKKDQKALLIILFLSC